jgi:LmbE family N-acetylglucosaminyl deacetylase
MKVLIVAAHSDDEVLGVGGLIAKHRSAGDSVAVQFMTDGVGARGTDTTAVARRNAAMAEAARILDFEVVGRSSFPDNALDSVPLIELVKTVEAAKEKVNPDVVLTHFWGDLNIDHRRTFEATITAFRPQPHERYRSILCFEVASATEWGAPDATFRPNCFVELDEKHVTRATDAYAAYKQEVREAPHARSLDAFRARRLLRGREVGVFWAEGLMTYRQVDRLI